MKAGPTPWQTFLAELKRRRVFRVMAVYGAVAFVLLQVLDLILEPLHLPSWTMSFVLVILLVGFPVAILLAWAFETTPEGVRRTERAAQGEINRIVAQPSHRRWRSGLLALFGVLLLFWGGWWVGHDSGGDQSAGRPAAGPLVLEETAEGVQTLAVLPFENVNRTEENRIVAVGLHDDLISQLAQISAIRVTSRTSVREYEDTSLSSGAIADSLGVEYLLLPAVQQSGNQLRVTVHLVDPISDSDIWSEQYDRELTPDNLLAIQRDIARSVVAGLRTRLTPEEEETLETTSSTSELAALNWYYRGRDALAVNLYDPTGGESRDALRRAVEIDPTFAAAWSSLAFVESRRVFIGEPDDGSARQALERTVELAPGSVEANLATGFYEYYVQRDYEAALTAFREAWRLAPSSAEAAWAVGLIFRRQGRWEAAAGMFKEAVRLDARNPLRLAELSSLLQALGAFEDADAVIERQLSVDPTNSAARGEKVLNLAEIDGNIPRARRLAAELGLDPGKLWEGYALAGLAFLDRDYRSLVEILSALPATGPSLVEVFRLGLKSSAFLAMGDSVAARPFADSAVAAAMQLSGVPEVEAAAYRAWAEALARQREVSMRDLRIADRWLRAPSDHFAAPRVAFVALLAFGHLGEIDTGLDVLAEYIDLPGTTFDVLTLQHWPSLDPYRENPRFAKLIEHRRAFEAAGARFAEAGRPWLP